MGERSEELPVRGLCRAAPVAEALRASSMAEFECLAAFERSHELR